MTEEKNIGLLNYAKKNDGTALAARLYYDTLSDNNIGIKWYQLADQRDVQNYMSYPDVIQGSKMPFRTIRIGYDRMIFFPRIFKNLPEDYLFLSDPTLIRIGLKKKGFAVKIHDLIPISEFSESAAYRLMFKYAVPNLKHSKMVVVTTEYMRDRLLDHMQERSLIKVVTDPVQDFGSIGNQENFKQEGDVVKVSYVAADRPYKNIRRFIDIAEYFHRHDLDRFSFTLLSRLKDQERNYLEKKNLPNFNLLNYVENVGQFYRDTDILLFTSLQEGFGRPIVEAMSAGTPSITLAIEPFIEVLGESGNFVQEDDVDQWAEELLKVSEPQIYHKASTSVRDRYLEKFSMKVYEKQLLEAFREFEESIA